MATPYNKQQILNLFLDNIVGDISPHDMRTFVEAIFDSKENHIHIKDISDELDYMVSDDLVVINDHGHYILYTTTKNQPHFDDLIPL